ncbi:predicted protein [Nematostella vectensis]|uniref:Ufm1-specific protease 2 n=1 Tax=Nematostella vectensis TaxID=45351 RepID=A7SLQ6_NEMVE|nr:predicted protein [Nematostella vectensis]|eukprot:XP_001627456.1 predicted protein [Nematostella vectensis]
MVMLSTSLDSLPKLFSSAVCRQLKQLGRVAEKFSKEENLCLCKPYHFKPEGFCHLVSVIYPTLGPDNLPVDDTFTESYRLDLHKQLLLPSNRPMLRMGMSYIFEKEQTPESYLINPHSGITSSGLPDGTVELVDGKYSYHHYMQDGFNDDGWGCAYRSLQTICSWFRHQGYTSKPAPSHHEIQQALVDIGDKKDNFIGSKQWIGSFEVSMCLEHLLGVTSKILYVNSGADMASKGRDLLHHFQTQGTPIMIGGGVLAHTIIGVDYNLQTGDIRFLILDPHYTGGEDLKVILDKGWCGWKGPNFWNQTAHYNMCMPQRPDAI